MAIRLHFEKCPFLGSTGPSPELSVEGGLNEHQKEKIDAILTTNPSEESGQIPIQSKQLTLLDSKSGGECAQKLHFPALITRRNQWLEVGESLTLCDLIFHKERIDKNSDNWDCVFRHCKRLKKLDLSTMYGDLASLDELRSIIGSAKKYRPNLEIELREEVAHLVCSYWFEFPFSEGLIQQLKILELLTVPKLITYQKLLGGDPNDWDCVFRHCKHLKKLDFSNAFESSGVKNGMIFILESIGRHCQTVQILDLSLCSDIEDESMACIATNFSNLTHLNLRSSRCSLKGLKSLAESCNHLISLNLSNCFVGNEEVLLIAHHFPKLRELDLTGSCNTFYTGSVTDRSVVVLAEKCPSLTHLSLPFSRISDRSLDALSSHCKELRYLYHCGCTLLTEKGITYLKQNLPHLNTSNDVLDFDNVKLPYEIFF